MSGSVGQLTVIIKATFHLLASAHEGMRYQTAANYYLLTPGVI